MSLKLSHPRWLTVILVLYFLLGLSYSVVVPLGEAPDEVDHFRYVQYLVHERRFPMLSPIAADNFTMEANQPPLYYLLIAALANWVNMSQSADFPLNGCFSFDPQDPGRQHFYLHSPAEQFPYKDTFLAFHLARALSLLMGAGTVLLAYELGRQIAPDDRRVGLLAAALLAFNPQFIFITASVNNDVLTALLGAAIILLSIITVKQPLHSRYAALGVLAGLGLLTKFALLALWPVAILTVIWPVVNRQHDRVISNLQSLISNLFLVLGLPLLIAGWWYQRAHRLYGDPLAWVVHLQAKGSQVMRLDPFGWQDLLDFVRFHFQSYWALFGWLNIAPPAWIYVVLAGMTLLGMAGLNLEIGDWGLEIKERANRGCSIGRALTSSLSDKLPLVLTVLAVSAVYVALLRYIQTINWSGYQGRLAYAAAAPIAALLALGLSRFLGRMALWLIPAALFLLSLGSLLFLIAPAYPRPIIYQPDPTIPRTCARFASGLALEAFTVPERLRPGEQVPVTLYGYGLVDATAPQKLRLQLTGRDGAVVGQAEAQLSWRAAKVVSTTLLLPVTEDAEPALALLQAGLPAESGEWQVAHSINGRVLEQPLTLTTAKIEPAQTLVAAPQYPVRAKFDSQIALTGYDLNVTASEIRVTLYWQALAPMTANYATFVHLLDATGQLVAQHDSQPHGGAYPTSIWDAGEAVTDTKTLPLPAATIAAPYQLAIGVYRPETLARLPVWDAAGTRQPHDQFLLPISLGPDHYQRRGQR